MQSENTNLSYNKLNADEVFEVGDIVMLDANTGLVTRAVAKNTPEKLINSKLVIGVCLKENKPVDDTDSINGGTSDNTIEDVIQGGTASSSSEEIIDGNNNETETSSAVEIGVTDHQLVNIAYPVKLGDKLVISNIPGKARSYNYLEDKSYLELRTIGKVIKLTENENQVIALLDIE